MIQTLGIGIDDVLRRRGWAARPATSFGAAAQMAGYAVLFGLMYGAVMGTYAGFAVARPWDELRLQMLYSALKVPLLLAATCVVSLPSFFVVNTLFGLRDDFAEAARAVAAAQAGLAIILASLAPLTLTWYLTSSGYSEAIFVNGVMFAVAGVTAQKLLRTYYGPLIARNSRHRAMLWCWLAIYAYRRHPDGLGAASVHRQPVRSGRVCAPRFAGQRLRGSGKVDCARAVWVERRSRLGLPRHECRML